jgi:uncharacterized membrane protein HdeD (DUF308 family)
MVILLARNWWALASFGFVAVLFGVAAFAWPGLTLVALTLLFGVYALVDGAFAVVAAIRGDPRGLPWWALLIEGLLGLAAGVLTLLWPGLTALALLYLIAAWAVATGVFEIAAATRLRKEIAGEWLLTLGGILSVGFGLALVLRPAAGALALIWLIGAYALGSGILLLVLALRLRAWARQLTALGV